MSWWHSRARRRIGNGLVVGASLLYPFAAAFGMRTVGPEAVVGALCVLALLRLVLSPGSSVVGSAWIIGLPVIIIGIVSIPDAIFAVRLYPVLVNAIMLSVFAGSLRRPPRIIERFARMADPHFSPAGVAYTRKVTWVWCVFFAVNGTIAASLALYGDWPLWVLYNGVVAYVAAGCLFAGEYLVRRRVRYRAEGGAG